MLEDPVLYLLISPPHFWCYFRHQNFSLIPKSLISFLRESREQFSLFEKVAHLLLVRAVEPASAYYSCALHYVLPKHWQDFASQPLRIDEWQREVDEARHVEPFRAEHSELRVLLVQPIEQFLEVHELQLHLEKCVTGFCNCKGFTPRSELASDGYLEHSAWGRPQLVRALPVQNYQMQILHSRETATGYRTYGNFRPHRFVSNPPLDHAFRPYQSYCGMIIPPDSAELTRRRKWGRMITGCQSRGCGFRCTQVRQVSNDDLMELCWQSYLEP